MKLFITLILLAVLALGVAACGKNSTSLSLGAIDVNGPGIDGSIPAGTKRVYTLRSLNADQWYTVRTEIATDPTDTSKAGGTLTVDIYASEDAFKNNEAPLISSTPVPTYPYVYEAYFQANPGGDYVAVISGTSFTNSATQFFYGLRLMSADPAAVPPVLTSFQTPTVSQTVAINPGYIHVYNGGQISSSGTYTINLSSTVTSTIAFPQLFVYRNSGFPGNSALKIEDLLYSSVTDSTNFNVTIFSAGTPSALPLDPNNNINIGVTIAGVPFTSGTTTGSPFIVVKGTSAVTYTLKVEQ
ncbi:MAG: hypothetical protein ACM3MD_05915 [Betaproteobacteria bacterium]